MLTRVTTPESATRPVHEHIASLRWLAAYAMLGYAGLTLLFTFFDWLIPSGSDDSLLRRSHDADFINVFTMALPVLAVLVAAYVVPVLPSAKLVATIALAEYGVAVAFGGLALVLGLSVAFEGIPDAGAMYALGRSIDALAYLVVGLAGIGLTGVFGYVTLRAFDALGGRLPGPLPRP
jgi:hypothetical protein